MWMVELRCEHGRYIYANVIDGMIQVATHCKCDDEQKQSKPSRLRIWWETKRMRLWLHRWKGVIDERSS